MTSAFGDDAGTHELDAGQLGVGDMDTEALTQHGYAVVDWIAQYLASVEDQPVLSQVKPGDIAAQLPTTPPQAPESFDTLLQDIDRILLPGITHWNHPAFHAYFAITGSGPGILAEAIIAALNVNGMLWRTSPAATELEEVVVDWLRSMLGLPAGLRGMLNDSASTSTLVALAAAREATDLDVRQRGLAGRADVPLLRIYTSEEAHTSIEKAAITLGLGRDGVRHIPTDDAFRIDVAALEEAIREDLRFGYRPMAIVPTIGTTSTTSIDPVADIAALRDTLVEEFGAPIWLHVDGAYGGMAAISPDFRHVLDGVEHADSFVTNPHKWLFTPIDASLLLIRDPSILTRAFSLVPEYLTTDETDVTDYMDWGVQLGRRFRALKLWMVIRYFGVDGLARRIRYHVDEAQRVAAWVDAHPDLARSADVPLSTVCFRAVPSWWIPPESADEDGTDDPYGPLNRVLMRRINESGQAFLSHSVLRGEFTLRLAIGNLRTTEARLDDTLALIDATLSQLRREHGAATPS